ncbi:MAG: ABC transporter permease [Candidatus Aminicenantes bacterium]|nr:MAG: ABC transporter permease [Candidatus Aminicenantes bacterium]UCH98408.1 MAG: ABC transporter permease [Candidatus Aminicenantes bacterium]
MFKGYLKVTLRNILKHKGYSFINILGLAMGMVVCILIFLWVQDELSFDRFHKNSDRIYRVVKEQVQSSGEIFPVAVTPWPLGAALEQNYPEIINFTKFCTIGRRLITYKSESGDKSFYENGVCLADPSFLEMFSFPFVKGDPATALSEGHSVVITEEIAEKYFGNENPLGKTITSNQRYDLLVTGVVKNVPQNSHLKFDFLIPLEPTLKNTTSKGNWFINNFYTYILLEKNVSVENLKKKVYSYLQRLFPENTTKLKLQALTDIHLHSNYAIDLYGASKDTSVYIYMFSLIAVFILLIACFNFVNLAVARASTRALEVGIKKVVGARRKNLIVQFFGESIFLTIISFIFALILVYLLLPLFNNLAGKELTLNLFSNNVVGPALLLIAIITGIIAGIYPAVIQSSFQPTNVIKGNFIFGTGKPGSSLLRKALVVLQFTCSITLIIGTLVVNKQLIYTQDRALGYEKDHMIYFPKIGEMHSKYHTFKKELLKNPSVYSVTTSSDRLTYSVHSTGGFQWEGQNPDTQFMLYHFSVDYDYIKTFKMKILDGRDFSKEFTTDAVLGKAYIINEAALKAMDLKDPVGKKFIFWQKEGSIIGVVKDFHFKSLHTEIEPLVLRIDPNWDQYVFVKLRPENITDTLNYVKEVYKQFNPKYPLEYYFLDDQLNRLYDSDRRTFKTIQYFTFIAIFISCLGLFGLASFMAQRRFKEIGIRKVLGATISNIVVKLSKEFLLLVVGANILAWPIAYFLLAKWLQNFSYRTTMSVGIFIFSALLTLVIAICTVIYQSVKAATANPVDAIRYE